MQRTQVAAWEILYRYKEKSLHSQGNKLLEQVAESLFLDIFKVQLYIALDNLLEQVILLWEADWDN